MHDKRIHWWWLMAAWAVALISTLGALFIGEVMGMTPAMMGVLMPTSSQRSSPATR